MVCNACLTKRRVPRSRNGTCTSGCQFRDEVLAKSQINIVFCTCDTLPPGCQRCQLRQVTLLALPAVTASHLLSVVGRRIFLIRIDEPLQRSCPGQRDEANPLPALEARWQPRQPSLSAAHQAQSSASVSWRPFTGTGSTGDAAISNALHERSIGIAQMPCLRAW